MSDGLEIAILDEVEGIGKKLDEGSGVPSMNIMLPKRAGESFLAGDIVKFDTTDNKAEGVEEGVLAPMLSQNRYGGFLSRPFVTSDGNLLTLGKYSSAQNTSHHSYVLWSLSSSTEDRELALGQHSVGYNYMAYSTGMTVFEVRQDRYLVLMLPNPSYVRVMFCDYNPSTKSMTFHGTGTTGFSGGGAAYDALLATSEDTVLLSHLYSSEKQLIEIEHSDGTNATVSVRYTYVYSDFSDAPHSTDWSFKEGVMTLVSDTRVLVFTGATHASNQNYIYKINIDPVTKKFVDASQITGRSKGFYTEGVSYDVATKKFVSYRYYPSSAAGRKLYVFSYDVATDMINIEHDVSIPNGIMLPDLGLGARKLFTYKNGYIWTTRYTPEVNTLARYKFDIDTAELGLLEPVLQKDNSYFYSGGAVYVSYVNADRLMSMSVPLSAEKYGVGVAAKDALSDAANVEVMPSVPIIHGSHDVAVGTLLPAAGTSLLAISSDDMLSSVSTNKAAKITAQKITNADNTDEYNAPVLQEYVVYPSAESYTVYRVVGSGDLTMLIVGVSGVGDVTFWNEQAVLRYDLPALNSSEKSMINIHHPYPMVTYIRAKTDVANSINRLAVVAGGDLKVTKAVVRTGAPS